MRGETWATSSDVCSFPAGSSLATSISTPSSETTTGASEAVPPPAAATRSPSSILTKRTAMNFGSPAPCTSSTVTSSRSPRRVTPSRCSHGAASSTLCSRSSSSNGVSPCPGDVVAGAPPPTCEMQEHDSNPGARNDIARMRGHQSNKHKNFIRQKGAHHEAKCTLGRWSNWREKRAGNLLLVLCREEEVARK